MQVVCAFIVCIPHRHLVSTDMHLRASRVDRKLGENGTRKGCGCLPLLHFVPFTLLAHRFYIFIEIYVFTWCSSWVDKLIYVFPVKHVVEDFVCGSFGNWNVCHAAFLGFSVCGDNGLSVWMILKFLRMRKQKLVNFTQFSYFAVNWSNSRKSISSQTTKIY